MTANDWTVHLAIQETLTRLSKEPALQSMSVDAFYGIILSSVCSSGTAIGVNVGRLLAAQLRVALMPGSQALYAQGVARRVVAVSGKVST